MNIWDSVQRGLEKATQEATRLAKVQRLRATLESVSKQIETQQEGITQKAMELFKNGQLTQKELLVLCQELGNAQQQFAQVQNELKQVQQQSQSSQGPTTGQPNATVAYTQPTFQPYDNSQPSLVPPPPPGMEPLTISSHETMRIETPPPPPISNQQGLCTTCHALLIPEMAFCHNCGTPINNDFIYQPTVRGNSGASENERHTEETVLSSEEQATIRATHDEASLPAKDGGL